MPDTGKVVEKLIAGAASGEFFDGEFARHLESKVRGSLPSEKADAAARQLKIARELQAEGSVVSNVTGQKLGSVDARVYHRWNQEFPGCWRDKKFVDWFLWKNPQCRSRGWRPVHRSFETGVSFSAGKPVSPHSALSI
jgi:hypothetical protein